MEHTQDGYFNIPLQVKVGNFGVPPKGEAGHYTIFSSEESLIPPGNYGAFPVPTNIKVKIPKGYVGQLTLHEKLYKNTPLVLPSGVQMLEGGKIHALSVHVKNTYLDSLIVNYALDTKGNKKQIKEVERGTLNHTKKWFEQEMKSLMYKEDMDDVQESDRFKNVYNITAQRGTLYIGKQEPIARLTIVPVKEDTVVETVKTFA